MGAQRLSYPRSQTGARRRWRMNGQAGLGKRCDWRPAHGLSGMSNPFLTIAVEPRQGSSMERAGKQMFFKPITPLLRQC